MMYELYYWPGLPGRGEFVRLVLEQAQAQYTDIGLEQGFEPIAAMKQSAHGFAPPYLKDGDKIISQAPAICFYLGRKHALIPNDEFLSAKVLQLLLTISDVVSEVHDTHHPLNVAETYENQIDAAKLRAQGFVNGRLKQWLNFFSNQLENKDWLANDLSVADLCLFQLTEGLAYAFPNAYEKSTSKNLVSHNKRVSILSNIKTYLESNRRQSFNENGIFRRYPELDCAS